MIEMEDATAAADVFVKTASRMAQDFARGDVAGEEDFSGQLVGRLKGKFEDFETSTSRWKVGAAITEADDGPVRSSIGFSARQTIRTTEEPATGADMLFVLDIEAGDYITRKGLLIQAKRLNRGSALSPSIATELRSQCDDMLNLTSASFVFLYSTIEVAVLSAAIVEGSKRDDLHKLEQWKDSAKVFFLDFVKCWIGDPRLKATDKQSLAVLRQRSAARNALLLKVEAKPPA